MDAFKVKPTGIVLPKAQEAFDASWISACDEIRTSETSKGLLDTNIDSLWDFLLALRSNDKQKNKKYNAARKKLRKALAAAFDIVHPELVGRALKAARAVFVKEKSREATVNIFSKCRVHGSCAWRMPSRTNPHSSCLHPREGTR